MRPTSAAQSVSNLHTICNPYRFGIRSERTRRRPTDFIRLYDWIAAIVAQDGRHNRQAKVLAALCYRAARFTEQFFRTLTALQSDVQNKPKRRTIITALQDLRAAGHIDYRSTGRGLLITIQPHIYAWVQKCKRCTSLNNKELATKKPSRDRGKPTYAAYQSDRSGEQRYKTATSYEGYAASRRMRDLTVPSCDEWTENGCPEY